MLIAQRGCFNFVFRIRNGKRLWSQYPVDIIRDYYEKLRASGDLLQLKTNDIEAPSSIQSSLAPYGLFPVALVDPRSSQGTIKYAIGPDNILSWCNMLVECVHGMEDLFEAFLKKGAEPIPFERGAALCNYAVDLDCVFHTKLLKYLMNPTLTAELDKAKNSVQSKLKGCVVF